MPAPACLECPIGYLEVYPFGFMTERIDGGVSGCAGVARGTAPAALARPP
jgi:hypothetical protein